MKVKHSITVVVLLVASALTTGCWDRIEIEERGTILALAIDPVEQGEADNITGPAAGSSTLGYRLTAQVAIPGKIPLGPSGGGGSSEPDKPIWIMDATGKTIGDAISVLQQKLAEKIFLGHLRIIIINKKLAERQDMTTIQDYLRRNAEIRRLAWLLVSQGDASDAMAASPKLERLPTLYLVSMMDHAVELGKIPDAFLGNFWSVLSSQGQDPILPLISVKGPEQISLDGLAVFKKAKMVGQLSPLEVAAYLEIMGVKRAGYSVSLPVPNDKGHSVTIRGFNRSAKIKLRKIHGRPTFDIYERIEANILENTAHRPVSEMYTPLSQEAVAALSKGQMKLIQKMKDLKADPFGFGEYVRGMDEIYWRHLGSIDKWHEEFSRVPIRVHMAFYVRRNGMTTH